MPIRLNPKARTLAVILIVAAAFIAWRIIAFNDERQNIQRVLEPQAGDIYEMATENSHYTLLKVARVQGDSVFVHINEYETDKQSDLDDLKDKPFSPEEIRFTIQTLRVMLKENKILDVER